MPGARLRAGEPIPDALLRETLGPDDRAAHVAAMRRLLHVAMTRARAGSCSPTRRARRAARCSRRRRSPRRRARRSAPSGRTREEELFGPDEALHATFQALRDELLADVARGRQGPRRAAPGHRPRRHARRRALPRARQARGAAASARPGQSVADALRAGQRAAGRGGDAAAARGAADLDARRAAARRRARRPRPRGGRAAARAEPSLERVPAAPRRRARAVGVGHRDLPRLPAALQVRARPADPAGADDQPALRDPRPPGARALPPARRRPRARRSWRCSTAPGRAAASATPTRSASCARRRRARCAATTQRIADEPVRAGLVRARVLVPDGRAHAARARRPRRPAAGRRLRAHRLQDRAARARRRRCARTCSSSLYAVGAREAWQLEASEQSYLYVLDDEKVRVPSDEIDAGWIADTVDEVGAGILAQDFEPTPSLHAPARCATSASPARRPSAERTR